MARQVRRSKRQLKKAGELRFVMRDAVAMDVVYAVGRAGHAAVLLAVTVVNHWWGGGEGGGRLSGVCGRTCLSHRRERARCTPPAVVSDQ